VFGGPLVGESAVQFEHQIGPQVVHTFEVKFDCLPITKSIDS